jgi:transcriptional regulator with XRE-family HTH domain
VSVRVDRRQKGQSAANRVGEHVSAYRKKRRLRISELARMVGVSPSLIGQIERGQSQPSVATLFALAESLEVPVDAFFARDETSPERRFLVRRGARAAITIDGGVRWERLTPETPPHVDFLELVYQPGAESNRELYRHHGTEMMLVLSGRLDVLVGFERYELRPGDSIYLPSSFPHRSVNPGDEVARAVMVILHAVDLKRSSR